MTLKLNILVVLASFVLGIAFATSHPILSESQPNFLHKTLSRLGLAKTTLPSTVGTENGIQVGTVEYKYKGKLSKGADGEVGEFVNEKGHRLAVKIAHSTKPNLALQSSPKEEAHLLRQSKLLKGKMTFIENGNSLLPMKFVKGKTYASILAEYQKPNQVLKQVKAIDRAIQKMEAKGIEHRDLHLNNIMYDPVTNKATIIDFGRAAASIVTDENGKKINLRPYGDRVLFLSDMQNHIQILKETNKDLDYSGVEKFIATNLNKAKKDIELSDSQVQRLLKLENLKDQQIQKLIQMPEMAQDIEKMDKKQVMTLLTILKEMKQLFREKSQLTSSLELLRRGIYGKQNQIWEAHSDPNFMKTFESSNQAIDSIHDVFQVAKSRLAELSKVEEK